MEQLEKYGQALQLTNIDDALLVAQDCAKIIREKHLSAKIQSKEFVMVEGWQFAGTRFGIIPIADNPHRIEREGEIVYECSCDLLNVATGIKVGHGYALCSNFESSKKSFAEYAIASMSQTRSIGKAYRNLLSWLMKASGFEPTPFEEMDEVKNTYKDEKIEIPQQRNFTEEASRCGTLIELKAWWESLSAQEKKICEAVKKNRKEEIETELKNIDPTDPLGLNRKAS